jgi:acetolactate synthase I/II/III large subunit
MKRHTLTHFLKDALYDIGVQKVFTIPGAHIEPFLISLVEDKRFEVIVCAHEEGAGFMADGYSSYTQEPSLVLTINGPGASNLMTAVATSVSQRSPVLYITGDVPTQVQGLGGFQSSHDALYNNLDLFNVLLGPSLKLDPLSLNDNLNAFKQALQQKKNRPIHLNIPVNQFRSEWPQYIAEDNSLSAHLSVSPINPCEINHNIQGILLVIGDDIRNDEEIIQLCAWCCQAQVPVAYTLGAKRYQSLINEDIDWGVFGYSGYETSFERILDPALTDIFTIGMEFNERNTYIYQAEMLKSKHFHIWHPESALLPKFTLSNFTIYSSLESLKNLLESVPINKKLRKWAPVQREITSDLTQVLNQENLVKHLNLWSDPSVSLFLDSGDHRIYGSLYWRSKSIRGFYTAAKNAPMGWAIAAGIGASFSSSPTMVLTGDGCMLMHGNEIAVAKRYQRHVIFIVVKNNQYGRIAKRLKSMELACADQIANLPQVDWVQYAQSLGVQATTVNTIYDLKAAYAEAMNQSGPFLIEACVEEDDKIIKTIGSSASPSFSLEIMEEIYEEI